MPVESGSHLGPYELLAAIGAGGMGEVYRARDKRLDRTIAVKVLARTFPATQIPPE
jgi:serine/threonine protein kinase